MKKDVVTQLLFEAQSYQKFEDIEKLVEHGQDLSAIPVQPLFLALRATNKEQVALVLPKLSSEQRQAMLDIDIWKKDEIDPHSANWWLEIYGQCGDQDVRSQFARSEDFLLALKSQCVVHTFDAEDPMYPDSDNYFLTEDNQLLIEYPEEFAYVSELKQLVKDVYTEMGVEAGYAHLFKMVTDSYLIMEEENYQLKKERLRDIGFVDYYEALEMDAVLPTLEAIKLYVKERSGKSGEIDDAMKNQTLHAQALTPYQAGMQELRDLLAKLSDDKRRDFLQFNFVRLVNARIVADEALKGGAVAMSRSGAKARQRLELGFSFAFEEIQEKVFEKLDFVDLYRIGHSLLELQKKKIKRALGGTAFEQEEQEYFLGMWWNSFLDHTLDDMVKLKVDGSTPAQDITTMAQWRAWCDMGQTFIDALPFVKKFHLVLTRLRESGDLQDSFYTNYSLDTIDFEAIMLSSLINFSAGHFEEAKGPKMGVTLKELKEFYQKFFSRHGKEWLLKGEEDPALMPLLAQFSERFGLSTIGGFTGWLRQIIVEQMNGYEIDTMSDEDFKHVGGPMILIPGKH